MEQVAIALALLVGVSLGLLGGGGSILLVPLLVYVAGVAPGEAIALSLLVVGLTAATGAVPHAMAGNVDWRSAGAFGAAGMAGAYVGGVVGARLQPTVLLLAFAVMMVVTATAMLRGRRGATPAGHRRPWRIVADGLGVGLVTGAVGAGGGFLVVPALVLLAGLPMQTAVGTSLVVIAMKSAAGLAGYLSGVAVDWSYGLAVASTAVVGALVGARLADRVEPARLRTLFGWFVLAMAAVVLVQELPPAVVGHPLAWVVCLVVLVAVAARSRLPGPTVHRSTP